MAPRGTIWGPFCIVVTLSDIETIWTKFGQNPGFSLRKSVSLTPGPTVKEASKIDITQFVMIIGSMKLSISLVLVQSVIGRTIGV